MRGISRILLVVALALSCGCSTTLWAEVPVVVVNEEGQVVATEKAQCFGVFAYGQAEGPCGGKGGSVSEPFTQLITSAAGAVGEVLGGRGSASPVQPSGE